MAVLDAGGDGDVDRRGLRDRAAPLALAARRLDALAFALARGAGLPHLKEPLAADDLSVALAGLADLLLGAGLGAAAAAGAAGLRALQLDRLLDAGRDLFEGQLEVDLEAGAAATAAAAAASSTSCSAVAAAAATAEQLLSLIHI